jgi:saccharopine dehydrogenase-like NADP-dependent oxidoreductase
MAAKKILLLLDSDRYAFPLLGLLSHDAKLYKWKIKVGSLFDPHITNRLKQEPYAASAEFTDFKKISECEQAIRKSDLVIAVVQDGLLLQIADACISQRKTLISPARLNRQMALKKAAAKDNNVLVLMDCGFAPGLDHIIAKKAIDNIHSRGGQVSSFKTFSGSWLSQSADTNPWDFKLTEPAGELLGWGKHNNRQLMNGRMQHIPCYRLFERSEPIQVGDRSDIMTIPEGDSLYYRKIYDLVDAHTVAKGKLVRSGFDRIWNVMVKLGLTDSTSKIDFVGEGSYYNLIDSLLPQSHDSIEDRLMSYTGATPAEVEKLKWLGLFDPTPWNESSREIAPAHILQHLLEKTFPLQPDDRDIVVMQHQLGYEFRDDHFEMTATLVLEGESEKESALARVIGFTCGAAAKCVLLGTISVKGLHIPIQREIYDPILNELEELGIAFHITEQKFQTAEVRL